MDDNNPPQTIPPTNDSENLEPQTQSDAETSIPVETTPGATNDSAQSEPATATPQAVTSDSHHSNWLKRLTVLIVVLVLTGLAVWVALQINKPVKPVASAPVKHEVARLKIGFQQPFDAAFYPATSSNVADAEINGQVFEGLTKFQDKSKVVPSLATSWTNPDSTTWLFKLRSGVKFHDGNPLTAQAVKACLDASHNTDFWQQFGDTIKDVGVVDAQTIKITTSTPDPLVATKLTYFWIFDTAGKPNDPADGTGPYQLKPGTTISEKEIDLVAYNNYYGGRPGVQELDFSSYDTDDSVLAALQKHDIDMAQINDASLVSKAPASHTLYQAEGVTVAFLMPNTLKPGSPLANKTVRQAVYTALDPAALMKARGVEGKAATQIVPETLPGYDPAIKRPATSAEKAKQLLTQAGYPNGFTANFTYYIASQKLADEIKKELASAGITLTMDPQTDTKVLGKKAFSGGTDLYYFSQNADLMDASDLASGLVFQQNNYKSDQLTQIADEASKELNPAKRLKLLQQMSDTIMSDYAVFPLYEPNGYTWLAPSNIVLTQQNFTSVSGVEFWQSYSR